MKRKTVKKIFWFFILFLPLQYAAVGVVGVLKSEPWPALVLPAFKSVYENQDGIILTEPQFYLLDKNERKTAKIESETLFNKIKESQRLKFLRIHFSNKKGLSEGKKEWLQKQILQKYGEEFNNAIKITWPDVRFQYKGAVKVDTVRKGRSFIINFSNGQ